MWTTISGLSFKEIKPEAKFTVQGSKPKMHGVIVYTEGQCKAPVSQCWKKIKKIKKN